MARMLMISVTELVHLHAEKQKINKQQNPTKKHTEVSIQKTVLIDIWIQVFKTAWPRGPSD